MVNSGIHFKEVCRECKKVVRQCRCPDPNKRVIRVLCDDCKGETP